MRLRYAPQTCHPKDKSRHPKDKSKHPKDKSRHPKDTFKHPKDKSRQPNDTSKHPKDNSRHPKDKSKHPTDNSKHQTDKSRHQTPKNTEKNRGIIVLAYKPCIPEWQVYCTQELAEKQRVPCPSLSALHTLLEWSKHLGPAAIPIRIPI